MLTKSKRLTEKSDYEEIKLKGRFYKSESFTFVVLKSNKPNNLRFGFVVSTKVSKKAVLRNRAKRVLREVVRKKMSRIKKGYDCVFLMRPGIIGKASRDLEVEIKKIFIKAGLFNKK